MAVLPRRVRPYRTSYFATNFGSGPNVAAFPELWRGLVDAYVPALGPTGPTIVNYAPGKSQAYGIFTALASTQWQIGPGKQGGSIRFSDDSDGYILVSSAVPSTQMTWMAGISWPVNKGSGDAREDIVYGNRPGSDARPHLTFSDSTDGLLRFNAEAGSTEVNNLVSTTSSWLANRIYHIAVTWDGTNWVLYIDGVPEATDTQTGTQTAQAQFLIGQGTDGGGTIRNEFLGNFHYLFRYNRILPVNLLNQVKKDPLSFLYKQQQRRVASRYAVIAPFQIRPRQGPTWSTGFASNKAKAKYPALWTGLEGAWAFSLGPTGSVVKDISGKGNDGTFTFVTPAEAWVIGRYGLGPGYAFYDVAGNDHITLAQQISFLDTEPWSIFVRMYDETTTNGTVTWIGNDNTNQMYLATRVASTNEFAFNDSGNNIESFGTPNVDSTPYKNRWTSHLYVCDGADISLTIDNEPIGDLTPPAGTAFDIDFLSKGVANAASNLAFVGELACIYIWSRALTTSEARPLFNDPLSLITPARPRGQQGRIRGVVPVVSPSDPFGSSYSRYPYLDDHGWYRRFTP